MIKKIFLSTISIFLILIAFQANSVNQDTRPGEYATVDVQLNKCYKKIMSKLSASDQIKLRKAQRQWIIFRDSDCKWAFSADLFDCLIERTTNRLRELDETLFNDTSGNSVTIK